MPIYTAEASETFTVTFKNYDNSILKTETVVSGKSATPPEETPVKDGYFFVKWDKDYTNILENTIITAVFRKKINCQSVLKKCNNYTGSVKIPSFTDNLTTAFRNTNSINPEITFKLTKESSMTFGTGSDLGTFYGSAINKIKINGNINNALLLSMINALVKPTTIDIRQLSDNNISNIINDSSIMNAINTGIGGTSHTLLWNNYDKNYNYFVIDTNDTVGYQVTLHQPSSISSEATLVDSDLITDWGDGTVDSLTSHAYSSSGNYLIKTKLSPGSEVNNLNIIKCENIRTGITDMSYFFSNCTNLTEIKNFPDSITSMQGMFYNCSSLTSLDLSNFNTSNVTNMSYMFSGCTSLTSLDLSNFNTSNVTNMSYMFDKCGELTTLDLSSFNTSNVSTMSNMFNQCYKLKSLNITSFNTSKVTIMEGMFALCRKITSFNFSNFDTSKVTNMAGMFYQCWGLTTLDLSNFNTSNVTTIRYMFEYSTNLKSLDLTNWNLASVNETTDTFTNCSSLNSLIMKNSNSSYVNLIISLLPSRSSGSEGTITVSDATGINTSTAASKYWNVVVEQ